MNKKSIFLLFILISISAGSLCSGEETNEQVSFDLKVTTYASGSDSLRFKWLTHIAFGPDNQEIITDLKNNRFLFRKGPEAPFQVAPVPVKGQHSLVYNPADKLYYANDTDNHRLIAFADLTSEKITAQTNKIAGIPLRRPHDVVLDPAMGWLYAINPNSGHVFRFTAQFTPLKKPASEEKTREQQEVNLEEMTEEARIDYVSRKAKSARRTPSVLAEVEKELLLLRQKEIANDKGRKKEGIVMTPQFSAAIDDAIKFLKFHILCAKAHSLPCVDGKDEQKALVEAFRQNPEVIKFALDLPKFYCEEEKSGGQIGVPAPTYITVYAPFALSAIGHCDKKAVDDELIKSVAKFLVHKNPELNTSAACTLAVIGRKEDIEKFLEPILEETDDHEVFNKAVAAIVAIRCPKGLSQYDETIKWKAETLKADKDRAAEERILTPERLLSLDKRIAFLKRMKELGYRGLIGDWK